MLAPIVAACLVATLAHGADEIAGASSGEHLFIVSDPEPQKPGADLLHRAASMEPGRVNYLLKLSGVPRRLAAWDNTLWLILPGASDPRRLELYRTRVRHNPIHDTWFADPANRLEPIAALPPAADVLGFVGTADGPIALLAPGEGAPLRLVRLAGTEWRSVDTGVELVAADESRLLRGGPDGSSVRIVHRGDGGGALLRALGDDGTWVATEVDVEPAAIVRTSAVGSHPLVAIETAGGIRLAYLRSTGLVALADLEHPGGAWGVFGLDESVLLVRRPLAAIEMTSIDRTTGAIGPSVPVERTAPRAAPLIAVIFVWTATMTALMLVFFFRPRPRAVVLPPEVGVLPPVPRLAALLIDLVPAAAATTALLGIDVVDLARTPFLTTDLGHTGPHLLMIGGTIAHSTVSELLFDRTLGKAVVGARVLGVEGRAPRRLVLARNLVKLLVLVLPPLAIFTVLNPYQQGLQDQLARTVVVRREPGTEAD